MNFRVTPYIAGVAQPAKAKTVGASVHEHDRVAALTTGTSYTFRVKAVNVNGHGPELGPLPTRSPRTPHRPDGPDRRA